MGKDQSSYVTVVVIRKEVLIVYPLSRAHIIYYHALLLDVVFPEARC